MKTKNKSKLIFSVLIVLTFSVLIYAHASGITGVTKKSNSPGCTCHNPTPSADVIVTINGPESLSINQTANYTVTISGGPLVRAGTDIAVSAGTLAPLSDDLQLINGELTHVLPKAPVSGVVTFNFKYIAPANDGTQTIFANGNSVNNNGQSIGDLWNFAPNKIIQVGLMTGIDDAGQVNAFKLEQNYPNPFNPSTRIRYSIPKNEFVILKIYDLLGNEIATLVNEEKPAGNYEITFNINSLRNKTNISSGVYFYSLKAGDYLATKKLALIK
jgi:Secretion system C-terminal sorting domain